MRNASGAPPVEDLRFRVRTDPRTKESVVTAENRPDLGFARDRRAAVAINELRSRADAAQTAAQSQTVMLPGERR